MSKNFLARTTISEKIWLFVSRTPAQDKDKIKLLFGEESFIAGRYAGMTSIMLSLFIAGIASIFLFLFIAFFIGDYYTTQVFLSVGWLFGSPLITTSVYLGLRWLSINAAYQKHEDDEEYIKNTIRPTKWQNFYNFDYIIGFILGMILAVVYIYLNLYYVA